MICCCTIIFEAIGQLLTFTLKILIKGHAIDGGLLIDSGDGDMLEGTLLLERAKRFPKPFLSSFDAWIFRIG
jgi:hypothetical protein